ncbi:putative sugar O-methyltransferase [Kitasatospora sp. MY 5-36]|uniref:putative sugar O-methyltransferase n=1 Tax=Kitasatospora sp. MY 5-36 TaxID=1678027 RepID=UPI0006715AD4|nr:putative sugar O-methyltransferase [Kitasatospora sp. MY 5-36]
MDDRYAPSALWEYNNSVKVTEQGVAELGSFKSEPVNFKLALWDPQVNGVRYLKALIFELATRLTPENRSRLRRIRGRELGSPITVTHDGDRVCMDYLLAVHELDFISRHLPLDGARVLEIGAGYGRTCHAIFANHRVEEYCIVDLARVLSLSRAYLGRVLAPEDFARVRFVPVDDTDDLDRALGGSRFELCLNIDSFAEMPPGTVLNYLDLVDRRCAALYVNNPVGKYLEKELDNHAQGEEVVRMALATGLLRDVLDIHDSRAVEALAPKFLSSYRPGPRWETVADGGAVPWSYYWQALYRRSTAPGAGPDEGPDAGAGPA